MVLCCYWKGGKFLLLFFIFAKIQTKNEFWIMQKKNNTRILCVLVSIISIFSENLFFQRNCCKLSKLSVIVMPLRISIIIYFTVYQLNARTPLYSRFFTLVMSESVTVGGVSIITLSPACGTRPASHVLGKVHLPVRYWLVLS